jgi:hypothetical protein
MRMRTMAVKARTIFNLDKMGMFLSLLCAVHCILTPMLILSLPIMARYYMAHPAFHWILALMIFPVGVLAFYHGYRHHRRSLVFFLGIPGLLIVSVVPTFFHAYLNLWSEPLAMVMGSGLLVSAHWLNRRSCHCEIHAGQ